MRLFQPSLLASLAVEKFVGNVRRNRVGYFGFIRFLIHNCADFDHLERINYPIHSPNRLRPRKGITAQLEIGIRFIVSYWGFRVGYPKSTMNGPLSLSFRRGLARGHYFPGPLRAWLLDCQVFNKSRLPPFALLTISVQRILMKNIFEAAYSHLKTEISSWWEQYGKTHKGDVRNNRPRP